MTIRKVGGIVHWRIGRLGGSFYLASKKSTEARRTEKAIRRTKRANARRELSYLRRSVAYHTFYNPAE